MKLGFLPVPMAGHLNPMVTLGRQMCAHGHDVVVFGIPDIESTTSAGGLKYEPYGQDAHPLGSLAQRLKSLASLHGIAALDYLVTTIVHPILETTLNELPGILRYQTLDAMVMDTGFSYVGVTAMSLGIPYVQLSSLMHRHPAGHLPEPFSSTAFESSAVAWERNIGETIAIGGHLSPLRDLAVDFARNVGLDVDWSDPAATLSQLLTVSQTPLVFDFPVAEWPESFRHVGPLIDDDGRASIPFPWDELTGERLIYASLGTLVNAHPRLYDSILEAAAQLPGTQLVMSVGPNFDVTVLGPKPANAIVVRVAPQLALLLKAALCITYAGLNTVLETLVAGVPIVAIPIAFDQPGIAERIVYHGLGRSVAFDDVTPDHLMGAMREVLETPAYLEKARRMGQQIGSLKGPEAASKAIESALSS